MRINGLCRCQDCILHRASQVEGASKAVLFVWFFAYDDGKGNDDDQTLVIQLRLFIVRKISIR